MQSKIAESHIRLGKMAINGALILSQFKTCMAVTAGVFTGWITAPIVVGGFLIYNGLKIFR